MESRQMLVLLSVFFSCYLIFSLSFVSAYQISGVKRVVFIGKPSLVITDELRPVTCESSGYITFHAYVENIPEFDISGAEAFVEDIDQEETYNVTSSLSCSPKKGILSNEEITCKLKVKELLSNLPVCPFEDYENRFYLTLKISYAGREAEVSGSKPIVITSPDVEPELEVNFRVSYPPYPVPEINCRTGSEIDVPVVIKHAETLFGGIEWSFSVNGTKYGGSLITCEKILERDGEGREDIYLCTLVISGSAFPVCEGYSNVVVGVEARTEGHDIAGNFTARVISEDMRLSLHVTPPEPVSCQIIDEKGTCVPETPQQNLTVRIGGNVPQKLRVFESRYSIGEGEMVPTLCRKMSHRKYVCPVFVTIDRLPMPSKKSEITRKSRKLTMVFDVKYLNYYINISDSADITLEGKVISDILNTKKVLEKERSFLEKVIKEYIPEGITYGLIVVNAISRCCGLVDFVSQIAEGSLKEAFNTLMKTYVWGFSEKLGDKIVTALMSYGPDIINCIAEKGMKDIEKETKNLEKFEKNQITGIFEVPSFMDLVEEYTAGCVLKGFWENIKRSWMAWLCVAIVIVADVLSSGAAEAYIQTVCRAMKSPLLGKVKAALNLFLLLITYSIVDDEIERVAQAKALVRERINLQIRAGEVMTDYSEAFSKSMESLARDMSLKRLVQNETAPVYDMVKLAFVSERKGLLKSGDEICTNDRITIEYDFEKLGQIEGFSPRLSINPSRRGSIIFSGMKGTYGPYFTDTLLGTDPETDPSETYTFTLTYGDKRLNYPLYYVNHACA